MDEYENSDCYESNGDDDAEDQDPLFGDIVAGSQENGAAIIDLGWAGMMMSETLGIECLAGTQGFGNADEFYRWMQVASGSALADWYGVQLRLYECGYSAPMDEPWCYMAWRTGPDNTALMCRAVDLFCLRHTAWEPHGSTRRAFNSARTRSYCEASHIKTNPGDPVTPQIMAKTMGDGLTVSGIRPGESGKVLLDWPTADMGRAFEIASVAERAGVREICMSENGIGVELRLISQAQRERLLAIDRYYGGDIMLVDALARAGLV